MNYEYKKTIAVWTDNKTDQDILSKIISGNGYDPFLCEQKDDLLPIPYFLLFAKYSREAAWFIGANKEIRKKVKDGNLKCAVLYHLNDPDHPDEFSRGQQFPKDTIKIDMDAWSKNEIDEIIENQAQKASKINKRHEALAVKLNRLFYIYSQLVDKGEISVEEILEITHISRRTLSRDIRTIREVCIDKLIENQSDFNVYVMRDLKNENQHGDH